MQKEEKQKLEICKMERSVKNQEVKKSWYASGIIARKVRYTL